MASVVLFSWSLANGQDLRTDLTLGSIEISLVLPVGLQPFSEKKMAQYREEGGGIGKYIFSSAQADLLVIIDTFGSEASDKGLTKVADKIEAGTKERGVVIGPFVRRFITMNGKKWLHVSFRETSASSDLINDCFVTAWIGRYVLVEFSCEVAHCKSYKPAVTHSMRSVELGFIGIN
jgi:hypothetical protein